MNEEILKLFVKYKTSGVLVDSNLLLLFVVGSLGPELIPRVSRTANYSFEDFQVLEKTIEFFEQKITTPNILTEVSNLIGNRGDFQEALGAFISEADEIFLKSINLVMQKGFSQFGLADTATFEVAKNQFLVITDDGPLYGFLRNIGVDVVNLLTLRKLVP